jgi:hypothetical protein
MNQQVNVVQSAWCDCVGSDLFPGGGVYESSFSGKRQRRSGTITKCPSSCSSMLMYIEPLQSTRAGIANRLPMYREHMQRALAHNVLQCNCRAIYCTAVKVPWRVSHVCIPCHHDSERFLRRTLFHRRKFSFRFESAAIVGSANHFAVLVLGSLETH